MFRVDYVLTSFFLLSSTGPLSFVDRIIYGNWSGKGGDKFTQTLSLLAIIASLLLFWRGAIQRSRPRLNQVLPLAAVGFLVSSTLWSVEPSTTITRSIAYSFLVVGAIGVVQVLDTDEVMRLIASISALSAAGSLLLPYVRPDAAMDPGGFLGLFAHKNVLGQAMAIGVLAGLHGMRIEVKRRSRYFAIIILCTITAFLSKSTTSLVTIFVFFSLHIIGGLYIKGGGRRALSIYLTFALIPTCLLVMTNKELIFGFLEKDATLTGRTDLWPYVIDLIYERPLLGWGFTGFWNASNPRLWQISIAVGWYVPEAHNGMLQLLMDVGLIGAAIFLSIFTRNMIMAVKCMNGPGPAVGLSSLLLLVGILIIGVSEQVLVTVDGPTLQFFLLGFMCEQSLRSAVRPDLHPPRQRSRLGAGAVRTHQVYHATDREQVMARTSVD